MLCYLLVRLKPTFQCRDGRTETEGIIMNATTEIFREPLDEEYYEARRLAKIRYQEKMNLRQEIEKQEKKVRLEQESLIRMKNKLKDISGKEETERLMRILKVHK